MSVESPEAKWMREVDEQLAMLKEQAVGSKRLIADLEDKSAEAFKSVASMMTQLKGRIDTLEAHQRHFFQSPGAGIGQAVPIVRPK